jgi:hypothetical protein
MIVLRSEFIDFQGGVYIIHEAIAQKPEVCA